MDRKQLKERISEAWEKDGNSVTIDAAIKIADEYARSRCVEELEKAKTKSITDLEPLQWASHFKYGSKEYDWLTQCVFELIDNFNGRIDETIAALKAGGKE